MFAISRSGEEMEEDAGKSVHLANIDGYQIGRTSTTQCTSAYAASHYIYYINIKSSLCMHYIVFIKRRSTWNPILNVRSHSIYSPWKHNQYQHYIIVLCK
jgi:hypothetical protein